MEHTVNKSEQRALRRQHAAQYAPRVRPAPRPPAVREDPQLRRLTGQVLEDLKRPDAIPSRVIMDALKQARALG